MRYSIKLVKTVFSWTLVLTLTITSERTESARFCFTCYLIGEAGDWIIFPRFSYSSLLSLYDFQQPGHEDTGVGLLIVFVSIL